MRRRPSLSLAVWIPTFYMMILGSRPLSDWVAGGGYNGPRNTNNPLDQLFFVAVLGGSLIIATKRGVNWLKFFASNLPLMLVYLYFVCGVLWSDDPLGSGIRIVKDFAALFVVGLVFSEKDPLQAIRAIFIRSACVLFPLSIVFNHYFPDFAREFGPNGQLMLSGVTGQKNALGEIVFLFCIFIMWDYLELLELRRGKGMSRKMSWDHFILFFMGVFLLVQSESKTALVCLAVAAAMTIRKGSLAAKPASTAAYAAVLSTPFLLFFSKEFSDVIIEPVVTALGRNMTFTGRTTIWEHITLNTVNPLIGCGYWNFWQGPHGAEISKEINWAIPTAHCGYLDIFLDGGILGLAVLFYMLGAYGWRLIRQGRQDRFRVVGLAVLCAAIIYNLSESSFVRVGPLWFATVLMMVEFPLRKKVAKRIQTEPSYQSAGSNLQRVKEEVAFSSSLRLR